MQKQLIKIGMRRHAQSQTGNGYTKRNMAETDVQVKVCQQEIVKLDLQIKAIIQVVIKVTLL